MTRIEPIVPPAPGTFSTMNCCPSVCDMYSLTTRATTSVVPPAANATTVEPPSRFTSFDHLVSNREQLGGNFKAKCLGRLEVDHELELGRLHHRQVGRLLAFEHATNIEA